MSARSFALSEVTPVGSVLGLSTLAMFVDDTVACAVKGPCIAKHARHAPTARNAMSSRAYEKPL